ncbi:hypothetical protein [Parvularcula marina]|uniref:hypothetical protein n=1 Tax=Parvularcula marina TaxID=2292771 RepID=UPI001314D730|nr:hypothetical protein [Parvularcula marina]
MTNFFTTIFITCFLFALATLAPAVSEATSTLGKEVESQLSAGVICMSNAGKGAGC